jgi:hypothetical protein
MLTVLAGIVVVAAILVPNQFKLVTPAAFARIPVEALLGVALMLVVPAWARRVAATLIGVSLGLLVIVKIIDMFFIATLARSADPILDWSLLGNGLDFVTATYGRAGGIVAVIVVLLLVVATLVLMTLAVLRLTRVVVGNRRAATRTVLVFAVAWVACAVTGVQIIPGEPIAAKSAAGYTFYRGLQAKKSLQDKENFAREAAVDAFRGVPGPKLLTGLRGKDVLVTFVESYGRRAVEDPEFAPRIGALLDDGNRRLQQAGYTARSGFLTSPTFGGGSWFAHATFLSGLWINNQQRYKTLVASDRLTLGSAFRQANWQTVGVMPAVNRAWPEGRFFGYDRVYSKHSLGYRGPQIGFSTVPDQYALEHLQRTELAKPGRRPVMAEIELVSSHAPWTATPELIDWTAIGDGSAAYDDLADAGSGADIVGDAKRARTAYVKSIEYSLRTVISYIETYGDDDLVLVFLGDHEPLPVVTGGIVGWDVPVTIVARDRAVLDRTAGWGWHDGLKPGPQAPVWRMDQFRDRFLTAFGG